MVFSFLLKIGLFLHLGLVEPVDDDVLALDNENLFNLARILEAHLTGGHAAVLLQIGPGCIDNGDIILLVALDGVGLGKLR